MLAKQSNTSFHSFHLILLSRLFQTPAASGNPTELSRVIREAFPAQSRRATCDLYLCRCNKCASWWTDGERMEYLTQSDPVSAIPEKDSTGTVARAFPDIRDTSNI